MITIKILGIDPFMLRQISRYVTSKLADVYECEKDEINFFAPEGLLVHDGVEQNTWNVIATVDAPVKYHDFEELAEKILYEYLKDLCINLSIVFSYQEHQHVHEHFRSDHPRFMTEENSFYMDEDEDDCDCDDCDHDDEEEPSDEDVYLGNVFEELDKENK